MVEAAESSPYETACEMPLKPWPEIVKVLPAFACFGDVATTGAGKVAADAARKLAWAVPCVYMTSPEGKSMRRPS